MRFYHVIPITICTYCKLGEDARADAVQNGWCGGGVPSRCCAQYVLSQQPDFLEQKEWLTEVVEAAGFHVIFFPKYHCELNFIEMIWGWIKSYHRRNCTIIIMI